MFSPVEKNAIYYGSQYLLKSSDGGLHWTEISPDLTGDERKPGAAAMQEPVTVANAKARGPVPLTIRFRAERFQVAGNCLKATMKKPRAFGGALLLPNDALMAR